MDAHPTGKRAPIPDVMTRRQHADPKDLSQDTSPLCDVINGQPDFSCIIICVSALDDAVTSLLGRRLADHNVAQRLLSTLSYGKKVDLAFVLGLITPGMFANLRVFGEIRNRCAHSRFAVDFGSADLAATCGRLTLPEMSMAFQVGAGSREPVAQLLSRTPRDRFTIVTIMMYNRLIISALETAPIEPARRGWEAPVMPGDNTPSGT